MNLSLLALAIAAFGIGTTEFVIMGLLPDVAGDLHVSIPSAGLLVTGYALGVAFGAPVMALVTARWPRKRALLVLMGVFIFGNALCALAANYGFLMAARVVTSLCHGAFFGIGSVEAASLVPANRQAAALSMMFSGLTIANVIGVPLGTALGQQEGWRSTFWAVTAIGVVALAALAFLLPPDHDANRPDFARELRALVSARVWLALGMTVLTSAGAFVLFTYIAPFLLDVTRVSARGVSGTLFLIGIGLTAGNLLGGRLADWRLPPTLACGGIALVGLTLLLHWTGSAFLPAEATLFAWGTVCFATCSALQYNAMVTGKEAPSLIATLNIGAFNLGNATGAWVGGRVIDAGFGMRAVPLAAAALGAAAALLTLFFLRMPERRAPAAAPKLAACDEA